MLSLPRDLRALNVRTRMRLLDRYLFRELCIPLCYCLAGFLIFWISFDLFSELEDFQKTGLPAGQVARYYLAKTPELMVTVLPVALLLAMLYALTNHGRHNEIVAMRAAGLSLPRISAPYLAAGLLLSLALFALNERLAPEGSARAEAIKRGADAQEGKEEWRQFVNFRNARENRTWNIAALNTRTFEMRQPHVELREADGGRRQLLAKSGIYTNGQWVFFDVELFHYAAEVDFEKSGQRPLRTNELVLPELTEKPEDILLQIKFQQMNAIEASKRTQLSLGEIQYLRGHLELNARDRALLETQFHARIAQPWTCLVVALVALPFGAGAHSRRNVFAGVAASIFICFAYFVFLRLGLALGTGGMVAPWLAAWLPNALFAAAGGVLIWRIK